MKKISLFTLFFGAAFLAAVFGCGLFVYLFRYPCVDFSILVQSNQNAPSLLYDEKGIEWGRFCYDKREPVSIHVMPHHLLQAFIAAEDWDFYNHHGLAWRSIIRSFLVNMRHGKIVQGASTITQQLVKMLFYDNSRTFKRKIKEQFLTLLVEQQFSKEHILETYLNHIYFGSGLYGVSAAAQRFWGLSVADLSADQSALLAAIICSPGHYSPLLFPYSALHRRNIILSKMEHLRFISHQEYETLSEQPLHIKSAPGDAWKSHSGPAGRGVPRMCGWP